ncbi:MAG: DNA-directed RNA polymerase subunit N [Candidatus Micrarchaeia archaeon]
MIPIRCFTCGAVIAHKYEEYKERIRNGEKAADVLTDLGIKRYCCRRMFLSHVDLIDEVAKYGRF